MPKKGDDRTRPVTEQILVKAARIYDAREDEDVESKDLKTYAEFLSREDAFTKVRMRPKIAYFPARIENLNLRHLRRTMAGYPRRRSRFPAISRRDAFAGEQHPVCIGREELHTPPDPVSCLLGQAMGDCGALVSPPADSDAPHARSISPRTWWSALATCAPPATGNPFWPPFYPHSLRS